MAEFGSVEHVKSLSRRELENLFRYVFKSRDELQTIITQQSGEIFELRRKVARQAKQLKEVQTAIERRNRELDRYRELVRNMVEWAYIDSSCDLQEQFADTLRELGVTNG